MTLVAWSCLWSTQILIADPLGQTVDLGFLMLGSAPFSRSSWTMAGSAPRAATSNAVGSYLLFLIIYQHPWRSHTEPTEMTANSWLPPVRHLAYPSLCTLARMGLFRGSKEHFL
jgi:hypothetical protein